MFLFLTYFTVSIIGSSFIHSIRTDSNVFFFYSWVIFYCVYVPQLPYPFVCQWTSRLLDTLEDFNRKINFYTWLTFSMIKSVSIHSSRSLEVEPGFSFHYYCRENPLLRGSFPTLPLGLMWWARSWSTVSSTTVHWDGTPMDREHVHTLPCLTIPWGR